MEVEFMPVLIDVIRITFTGRGDVNYTLGCTDTTWQNPNWTMGQIYSSREVKCGRVDSTIKPTELSAIA
jgi:hypothetical protein